MGTKTVAEKLLVKPGASVWISDSAQASLISPLPENAHIVNQAAEATTALVIAHDSASLRSTLSANEASLHAPSIFWVAYPKANRIDINRDTLWPILSDYGLRPIGQVAIDDVWSAMRFRPLKAGEAPFKGGR